jgi:hypothetical protein
MDVLIPSFLTIFSVPAGVMSMLGILVCLPASFPYHGRQDCEARSDGLLAKWNFKRLDFVGAGPLVVATTLLVAAFEEAGEAFAWNSAYVIALLTISGVFWITFFFWERFVTKDIGIMEPLFPWRLITSRISLGMILYVPHPTCVLL